MVSPTLRNALHMIVAIVVAGNVSQAQVKPLTVAPKILAEYVGVYRWAPNHFLYIQFWDELGKDQLSAFDESGEVRALYPDGTDKFFVGSGLATPKPVGARIAFERDERGSIKSLSANRRGCFSHRATCRGVQRTAGQFSKRRNSVARNLDLSAGARTPSRYRVGTRFWCTGPKRISSLRIVLGTSPDCALDL